MAKSKTDKGKLLSKPKEGRPSKYSQELADKICEDIATSSDGLRAISKKNNIDYSTVKRWLLDNTEFCAQYARAKEEQAEHLADEILAIVDDGTNDYMTITKGDLQYNVEDREVTSRSKLRFEARKWIASKLKPKKYGDKLDVTTDGEKIVPALLKIEIVPPIKE